MTSVVLPSKALPSITLSWLASAIADASRSGSAAIESVLVRFHARLDLFQRELRTLGEPHFEAMLTLSRETSTHYKWHLLAINNAFMHVWLHEYKATSARSSGYAQSVHSHRYPMSALLLTGGYRYTKYAVSVGSDNLHADVRMVGVERLFGGSAYSMDPSEFHSVTEIQDGTVSLMIQGRPVRSYSTSVDATSLMITTHTPIEYRLNNLRSVLDSANQRSPLCDALCPRGMLGQASETLLTVG